MLDFQAYLNGLSIKTIADTLTAQGVPTRSGQEQWKANTITYILTNEKYIGDTLFQKYYGEMTVPFKKHRNYGEMDQYYAKDTHEPIVEKTIFYAVQSLLKTDKLRSNKKKVRIGTHLQAAFGVPSAALSITGRCEMA